MQRNASAKTIVSLLMSIVLVVSLSCVPAVSVAHGVEEAANSQSAAQSAATDEVSYVPGEAIVVYENEVGSAEKSEVNKVLDDHGVVDETTISDTSTLDGEVSQVTLEDESQTEALIEDLNNTEGVAYAQPNYIYHLLENTTTQAAVEVNDPEAHLQYVLEPYIADNDPSTYAGANVEKAWSISRACDNVADEADVTVAVLDTGVRTTHEDLKDNIDTKHMATVQKKQQPSSVSSEEDINDYIVEQGACEDIYGHGTHVAGIVGASTNNGIGVTGVSYNANILPINIFYYQQASTAQDGSQENIGQPVANTITMLKAYQYLDGLIESGELTNLRVINMSLGGYSSDDQPTGNSYDALLKSSIKHFHDEHNVLSVCAGGNGDRRGNPITTFMYPGDWDECFSVTWLDRNGLAASSADYNEAKDISAPGSFVFSTLRASNSSYGYNSGSSMATPVVSGVAALLWAKYPDLTVAQVREAMQKTAHSVSNQPSRSGSAGAVDAAQALAYAAVTFKGEDPSQFEDSSPAAPEPVKKIDLGSSDVQASSISNQTYTGSALRPPIVVSHQGVPLQEGRDYNLEYRNNINAGIAEIIVTASSDSATYEGTKTLTFTIVPKRVSVPQAKRSLVYNGTSQTGVSSAKEYTVSGGVEANAGSYTAVARLNDKRNYQWADGSTNDRRIFWSIDQLSLRTATITLPSQSYAYTGKAIQPTPTVRLKVGNTTRTLQTGSEYRVSYSNNVEMSAAASLTIRGTGNYTDSVSKTFTITKPARSIADGVYTIRVKANTSYGLDIVGASSSNKANVQLYRLNETPAQSFKVTYDSQTGYYTIANIKSGKVLDVAGARAQSNTNVQQYTSNNTKAQRWIITRNLDGGYVVRSALNTNLVLDITSGRIANSTNVRISALQGIEGSSAQRFSFVSARYSQTIVNGTYYLKSSINSNFVVDVKGGSRSNKANVQLYRLNKSAAQRFVFTYDSTTGYYTIRNAKSNRVLDVAGAKMKNKTNIWQYANNSTWAQKWIVEKNQNGTYTIKAALNPNFVVDIVSGKARNSQNIQLYQSNGSKAQRFWLSRA